MEISNPLGSWGFSAQGLGNLTSGIQALQRTEIESKLRSLEQEKANKRADALRNEEFALKMASTDVINDRRVAIAEQAAKDAESFMQANADLVKKAQSEGRGLTLSEKMKIMTDQKKILQNNAQAANFTDALEKAQSIHISTLKTLKDPVSKEQYNKQWADLYQRMKDPVLSKDLSPSDIIAAVEPPDPPVEVVFNETAKELIPFVDEAVKEGANGREIVDEEAFMKNIKTSVDPNGYLFQKGVEKNRWKTPDEMYGQLADKVRTSIGINSVGWRPTKPTEKEKIEGFEGRMKSSVNEGETVEAYVFTKGGTLTGSYTPEGSSKPVNAKIRPIGIRSDGKLEAEFTIDKEVTTDPMDKDDALDLKMEVGGKLSAPDKDGRYTVIYTRPTKETAIVGLSQDVASKIRRSDAGAARYLDQLDPYPKRTAAAKASAAKPAYSSQEETGISRVMKANGISRDEAISALKQAGKLK